MHSRSILILAVVLTTSPAAAAIAIDPIGPCDDGVKATRCCPIDNPYESERTFADFQKCLDKLPHGPGEGG